MKALLLAIALTLGSSTMAQPLVIREVSAEALEPVLADLRSAAQRGDVQITINSPGGSVMAGLDFISEVKRIKRQTGAHVSCYVEFTAASMGLIILEGICDVRIASPAAFFLAHNSSADYHGTAGEVTRQLGAAKVIDVSLAQIAGHRLTIGVAGYRAKIRNGDWFFTAQEALNLGAIDAIMEL